MSFRTGRSGDRRHTLRPADPRSAAYAPTGPYETEAAGFEGAWTQEQLLGAMPILGPIETMSYAAACTERIRLGCAVFVTPLHNPVDLAKSLSTLDQLSRGRLEVGVGTGAEAVCSPPSAWTRRR